MNSELKPPGPLAPGGLRVTALGGISEIGRNMTVFEHLGRLLIVDCGVLFPGHDEPGVDLILPDLRHVEDRLDEVEALVLTHAHEDHIGAIPFLLKLRPDIPIVGSKFTLALVAEKCREHRIKPNFTEVGAGQSSQHGVFECEYFHVNHSIPGCLAIAIHTGAGTVLHTGDIKLDQLPLDDNPTDLPGMSRLGDAGVDLFLCDSTNSEIPGVGPSESEIGPNMHRLIRGAEGRVIVACFASNVARVQQIIDASVALGRKVSFVGRSMVRNMGIAKELGYLNVATDDVIDIGAAEMMAPERVTLVTTGTQGEPMAALSRMSRGEHRSITLTSGDLIIMSSSQIPGNEEAIFGVLDSLAKIGVRVVTNAQVRDTCFGSRLRGRAAVPLQRGAAAQRDAGARHVADVAGQCGAGSSARVSPDDSIVLAENGVSVDLVAGQGVHRGRGDRGQDVRRRVDHRRRRRRDAGRAVDPVVGLHRGDGRRASRHGQARGAGASACRAGSPRTPRRWTRSRARSRKSWSPLRPTRVTDVTRIAQGVRRVVGKWVGETYRRQPMIVPTVIEI